MAFLNEQVMDHFERSLFLQDEDVRADNDPLAWEDIEGCRVPENYAEEVRGVDYTVDEFFGDTFYDNWEERAVDGIDELGHINLKEITTSEVRLLHFRDRTVAFSFYQLYSKMNGFAVRKNRIRRNVKNEVTQQQFVCFREGFRDLGSENDSHRRKREPKPETRCGCLAERRVHVHVESGRWIISYFQDEHNHEMLDDRLTFMLPGHRKMNDAAIDQMNLMLKVGIKIPQIYSSFVHTAGGFQNVRFLKRDMYNQIVKQRRVIGGDAMCCLKFLESMAEENSGMFVRYLADEEGRLVHLFLSDSCSQLDYNLFGDVLAFDATYCKNKYMCPLVVFSGVNHHNQTIVFAAALVANEKEETYTWLLQQFLEAMKGKPPGCVITDGDKAMKKAIESVFPSAYHRLCAWHLLRNATSNLSNPTFTSEFKKCMLFDYEISEFEDRWVKLVTELGLQHNEWVCDLYARRKMWATAYIRGHFFGGFRTTSRCEGLHSMLGKFVHSRHNLRDFIEQFLRCICEMRSREAQSELASVVGDLVLQSPLHALERSAANILTREIFMLFRPMLSRACTLKVRSCTLTPSCEIYTLSRSGNPNKEWNVSHYRDRSIFKCSCFRMESVGIPCDHIVAVLVHIDAEEIPKSLLIDRWSKNARSKVWEFMEKGPFCWESMKTCRNWMLNDLCREICVLASSGEAEFNELRDKFRNELLNLKLKKDFPQSCMRTCVAQSSTLEGCVRDPRLARHTKRQRKDSINHPSVKGVKRCGLCRRVGHNRLSCQLNADSRRNRHDNNQDYLESDVYNQGLGEWSDQGEDEDEDDEDNFQTCWSDFGGAQVADDEVDDDAEIQYPYFSSQP